MTAEEFFRQYDEPVFKQALLLRTTVMEQLPGIIEVVDLPARMVAYTYGPAYMDMICTIIPSKKGLKLGFNRGTELPDPAGILEGHGKISRYVVIGSEKQIGSEPVQQLLKAALEAYALRGKNKH